MKKKLLWISNPLTLSVSTFAQGIAADANKREALPAVSNVLMLGIGQQGAELNKVSIKNI